MRKLIAWFLPLALCTFAIAQQLMNNDSVVKMVKAGLSDDIVISTINASPGQYTTTPDALISLKQAGVSDKVISVMVNKTSASQANQGVSAPPQGQPSPGTPTPSPETATSGQPNNKPRVYLESASKGTNRNAARDQSMEMSKDFETDCPDVRVTIIQQMADYTIVLNHIEVGLLVRDNQIQIANKDGDLISKTKEGGSIRGDVKKACAIILADWTKK